MATPHTPRRVAKDEVLADAREATAGPGTYVHEHEIRAKAEGVFEFDGAAKRCAVRNVRRPVAGRRRLRGEKAPEDSAEYGKVGAPAGSRGRRGGVSKKKKGMGDQGAWASG